MGLLSTLLDNQVQVALWSGIFIVSYKVMIYTQRLFFHPLSSVPGPRIAAASSLYEFYYDSILGGRLWAQLPRLHEQYGPIIRIGPNEVHISDSTYFDTLFSFSPNFDKVAMTAKEFGLSHALFAQESHKSWSHLRSKFGTAFSRSKALALKEMMDERIERACDYIRQKSNDGSEMGKENGVVDLAFVFRALPAEIITRYMFGEDYGFFEDEVVTSSLYDKTLDRVFGFSHLGRWLPFWIPMLIALIRQQVKQLVGFREPGSAFMTFYSFAGRLSQKLVAKHGDGTLSQSTHPIFFEDYLSSPALTQADRSKGVMSEHAVTIWSGGWDTVGFSLTVGAYAILRDPDVHHRLQSELQQAWSNADMPPSMEVLDNLPYLNAVIKENFRLSPGAVCRLTRVSTDGPTQFGNFTLPAGTWLSMSLPMITHDPKIWGPDHREFKPERWLTDDKDKLEEMERYLVTFSKGSRICPGIELTWVQFRLITATLFRRFDMEIVDAAVPGGKLLDEDIFAYYEGFTPAPKCKKHRLPVKIVGRK